MKVKHGDTVTGDTVLDSPQTIVNTKFEGTLNITAPDVTLDNCKIVGQHPDGTLVTCGPRTKIVNCDVHGSTWGQHRGIRPDASGVVILNTRVKNIFKDQDTQALGGWDGCKDLIAKNCEFEASGEVIIFGGSTRSLTGQPTNILIEDCLLTRKIEWRQKPLGATNKNLFELKDAKNLTMRRCVGQYSWLDGQIGYAILLTVRQDPSPHCSIENILIQGCTFRDTASALSILGHDDQPGTEGSPGVKNVTLRNNDFLGIDENLWGQFGHSIQIQILQGSDNLHILNNRFRGNPGSVFNSFLSLGGDYRRFTNNGLVVRGNDVQGGVYGLIGEGSLYLGEQALLDHAPGFVWDRNTVRGFVPYCTWPEGTYVVPEGGQ